MSVTIKLIAQTATQNNIGVFIHSETAKEVFAEVSSISASEFFEGGRNGLNPSYRFKVINGDYNGERIVEYDGKRYAVYRDFIDGDYIELYTEMRAGLYE